jgi:hypothetical protein
MEVKYAGVARDAQSAEEAPSQERPQGRAPARSEAELVGEDGQEVRWHQGGDEASPFGSKGPEVV